MAQVKDNLETILELYSFLTTFEQFSKNVRFPHILYNTFAYNTLGTTNQAQAFMIFLDNITDPSTSYVSMIDETIRQFTDVSSINTYVFDSMPTPMYDVFFPSNSKATGTLFNKIMELYQTPLEPIGPTVADSADKAVTNTYLKNMGDVFGMVFYMVLHTLYSNLTNSDNTKKNAILNYIQSSNICIEKCRLLCEKIFNAENFNTNMTSRRYVDGLVSLVFNQVTNTVLTNNYVKKIFVICFYPFFIFKYISNFIISTNGPHGNEKGSRSAYVRRFAIQSMYMFQIYTLYSIYTIATRISPSDERTQKLRLVLDSNAIYPFLQEYNAMMEGSEKIGVNTTSSFQLTNKISDANREIEITRNNINNIINAQPELNSALKKAKLRKQIWIIVLILYISFTFTMLFLVDASSNNVDKMKSYIGYIQIVSYLLIAILCVSGITYVGKKMYSST